MNDDPASSYAARRELRIASHFTDIGLAGGGVPRSTLEIARLMAAGGHDYTVMTAAGCEVPAEWRGREKSWPRVLALDPVRGKMDLLSPRGLRRAGDLLRRVDLLLLHGMWRPRNSQLARVARRLGVPYVMIPHGMLDDWPMSQKPMRKRLYHRLLERRNLGSAACVVTTSEAEREQAGKWVPHDRIPVAPLPIHPSLARLTADPEPSAGSPVARSDEPTVLFLSRLHPKKGVEVLIEAVGLLRRRGERCRLLIAGTGEAAYRHRLEELVRRQGIADRTEFLGWIDGPGKLDLYKTADLLGLPTSQENFGRVLIESLACRTPVVTTRATGLWRGIQQAGAGLLVERTAEAFAEALAELCGDPARRRRMGEAGREWVLGWLDDGRLIGQYEAMFRRAAGNGSA